MSTTEWLTEYFNEARTPMTVDELSEEFASLGGRIGGLPRASVSHWRRDIKAMVDRGELIVGGDGFVRLPPPKKETRTVQLSLFGD